MAAGAHGRHGFEMAVLGMLARVRAARQLPDDGSVNVAPGERLSLCPGCGGALAPRQRQCAVCGCRFVAGVALRKALLLTGFGAMLGGIVGVVGASSLALPHLVSSGPGPAASVAVAVVAGSSPLASSGPSLLVATPSAAPVTPVPATATPVPAATPPPSATSEPLDPNVAPALSQIAITNDRLAVASRGLDALVRSGAGAPDLAISLREIAAAASSASQILPRLRDWQAGARLRADLAAFYDKLGGAASGSASMSNNSAYRAIARDTQKVLDGLPSLASRTKAALATITP
jgi:hypothetical protein